MTSYQPVAGMTCSWPAVERQQLTGLIFVAVSINLTEILVDRRLPIRAAETLLLLLGLLLLAVFVLVPGRAVPCWAVRSAAWDW